MACIIALHMGFSASVVKLYMNLFLYTVTCITKVIVKKSTPQSKVKYQPKRADFVFYMNIPIYSFVIESPEVTKSGCSKGCRLVLKVHSQN